MFNFKKLLRKIAAISYVTFFTNGKEQPYVGAKMSEHLVTIFYPIILAFISLAVGVCLFAWYCK